MADLCGPFFFSSFHSVLCLSVDHSVLFFQRDDQVLGIGLLIRTLVWELFKDWDLFGLEELGWNDFLNKLRETDCRFEDSRSSDSYNRGLDASAIPSEYTVS